MKLPSKASVMAEANSHPIVLFVSAPLSYCSYSQKAIQELSSRGYDPKVIEASPGQRRVSDWSILSFDTLSYYLSPGTGSRGNYGIFQRSQLLGERTGAEVS